MKLTEAHTIQLRAAFRSEQTYIFTMENDTEG